MADYDLLGSKTIIPQADLENLVSKANLQGDFRKGGFALGKNPGDTYLQKATSGGALNMVFPLGKKTSDAWRVVDGSANVLPVNVLNAGGGAAWTLTTATYTGTLLTATTAAAINAQQVVALKKGTYRIVGTVNRIASGNALKIILTGATSGDVLNTTYSTATISATNAVNDVLDQTFTLTADENVTIKMNIVAVSGGANATGAAGITYIFEGVSAG